MILHWGDQVKLKKLKLHYQQIIDAEKKTPQWHWAYKSAVQNAEWGLWLIKLIEREKERNG